jgi:CTP synthase
MQVLELDQSAHPYFIAAQFHPELTSRPINPHPMFMGLVASAIARANPTLAPQEFLPTVRRWLPAASAEGDDERQSPSIETGPSGRI